MARHAGAGPDNRDDEFLFPALRACARGYLNKDATAKESSTASRPDLPARSRLTSPAAPTLSVLLLQPAQIPSGSVGAGICGRSRGYWL
jgi:hypothetical protein